MIFNLNNDQAKLEVIPIVRKTPCFSWGFYVLLG